MTWFSLIERVVIPTLIIFLLVGSVSSLILGVTLGLVPSRALPVITRLNHWISTRKLLRPLEIPRPLEQAGAPRHFRLGMFLLVGGALALYLLLSRLDFQRTFMPGVDLRNWFLSGLALQTMKWFFVAGSILALALGALIVLSPSTMTRVEGAMNRWYSTRKMLSPSSENLRMPLETLVHAHPQVSGLIIAVASLFVAAAMALLLFAR
jgi:hypothetical protein